MRKAALGAEGYTPEMHNGTKTLLQVRTQIGSRLGSRVKNCGTAAEQLCANERLRSRSNSRCLRLTRQPQRQH